jgi:hypothetical protein
MTPAERYRFDVTGYCVVEDAIEPVLLANLQRSMEAWEARSLARTVDTGWPCYRTVSSATGELSEATSMDVLDTDPSMVDLVANPRILPYVQAMVDRPILEQFGIAFRWQEGEVSAHAGHTPYQAANSYQVNDGRIFVNHLRVMYYMSDVQPGRGDGGLQIIPGVLAAAGCRRHRRRCHCCRCCCCCCCCRRRCRRCCRCCCWLLLLLCAGTLVRRVRGCAVRDRPTALILGGRCRAQAATKHRFAGPRPKARHWPAWTPPSVRCLSSLVARQGPP